MALQHTSKAICVSDCKNNEKGHAYWLVYVTQEFLGRELYYIVKTRGCRNDSAAINQLCGEASSVTRTWINCDNIILTSLLLDWPKRPILKKALPNELTINVWLTGNPFVQTIINVQRKRLKSDSRARFCQWHAVRESRANCQKY